MCVLHCCWAAGFHGSNSAGICPQRRKLLCKRLCRQGRMPRHLCRQVFISRLHPQLPHLCSQQLQWSRHPQAAVSQAPPPAVPAGFHGQDPSSAVVLTRQPSADRQVEESLTQSRDESTSLQAVDATQAVAQEEASDGESENDPRLFRSRSEMLETYMQLMLNDPNPPPWLFSDEESRRFSRPHPVARAGSCSCFMPPKQWHMRSRSCAGPNARCSAGPVSTNACANICPSHSCTAGPVNNCTGTITRTGRL